MRKPNYTPDTAEVRVNKQTHFTITPIKDVKAWKAERLKIEEEYHEAKLKRFSDARDKAIASVKGERQADLLTGLDSAESAYMDARKTAKAPTKITWEQIQAKKADWNAKNEATRTHYDFLNVLPKEPASPQPSLYELAKRSIARFIRSAFPQ